MARPLRIEYPGAFYHVISRGNARQKIFVSDLDKEKFLSYLETGVDRFCYKVHAYCLLDNHYHLLMETAAPNLSKILQRLNSAYATYFSRKRNQTGHLLQGRPKVLLIDKDAYALELSRYIHLNPVRAGIVRRPEQYRWSSYVYYMKRVPVPAYLETSFLLGQFDKKETAARDEMRNFVEAGRKGKLPDPFKDERGGAILGSEAFIHMVRAKFLMGRKKDRELPGLRGLKSTDLWSVRGLVEESLKNNPKLAKKAAIYLCRKYSERTLGELGEFFEGLSVSAVNQVVRRLDGLRLQDRALDQKIKSVESAIRKLCNV